MTMSEIWRGFRACLLITSLVLSLCYPSVMVRAYESIPVVSEVPEAPEIPTIEPELRELVTLSIADLEIPPEPVLVPMMEPMYPEGATPLGEFKLTYYCCEKRAHICGTGNGITASGRPVEAGKSIAVDPSVIPLGSRVFIDFGDGEGWHEYSADDVGGLVKGNHIDIAIATHAEALSQTKLSGSVCYIPPQN